MLGVGRIFGSISDGDLEDDDEVAVVYGPAETGYIAASEAMVNIRRHSGARRSRGRDRHATRDRRLIRHRQGRCSITTVGSMRCSRQIRAGVGYGELDALDGWLPGSRVDQREDALAMIEAMQEMLDRGIGGADCSSSDALMDALCYDATRLGAPSRAADSSTADGWPRADLEELRLRRKRAANRRARALLRLLAGRPRRVRRQPAHTGGGSLTRLRARVGLFSRADLDPWFAEQRSRRRPRRNGEQKRTAGAVGGACPLILC